MIKSYDRYIIIVLKEVGNMSITATEFKTNMGKYLLLASKEDIFITKNGKPVAKLTSPYQQKLDVVESLFGVVPNSITLDEVREERLKKI